MYDNPQVAMSTRLFSLPVSHFCLCALFVAFFQSYRLTITNYCNVFADYTSVESLLFILSTTVIAVFSFPGVNANIIVALRNCDEMNISYLTTKYKPIIFFCFSHTNCVHHSKMRKNRVSSSEPQAPTFATESNTQLFTHRMSIA